jgi:fatty acid desaturase
VPVVPALCVLALLGPAGLSALALTLPAGFHLSLAAALLLLLLGLTVLTVLVHLVGHAGLQSWDAYCASAASNRTNGRLFPPIAPVSKAG